MININGEDWEILLVSPFHPLLLMSNGNYAIGACDDPTKTIVINVGAKDGIRENMTVIAAEGLVGHVIAVTQNTAKVQTIIDSSSSTSCLLSTSRDSIVCKGVLNDKKNIKAMYIATDATVAQGDSIETSGLGGIYPKGIYVGTISKIENSTDLSNRYALVELGVNFDKLETVLVVTN